MAKKSRIEHTAEYNKVYWDMMNSKKAYKQVNGKQSPVLKKFFKKIYKDKLRKIKKEFK